MADEWHTVQVLMSGEYGCDWLQNLRDATGEFVILDQEG